jgi:hypothetical protein
MPATEILAPGSGPDTLGRNPEFIIDRQSDSSKSVIPSVAVNAPEPPARFNTAMARAQCEFKPVAKSKTAVVKSDKGSFTYKYADLADILEMALPILAKHGLSLRQPMRRISGATFLITEIHHESGEWIGDDGFPIPMGGSPQAIGSALTYFRRYGFCNMAGIAPDADEDGQLAAADRRDQEALRDAQRRNAAALGTKPPAQQDAGPREAVIMPGEPVWDDDMCKAFNRTWKEAGHTKEAALAYMINVLGVKGLKLAHAAQHGAAMAWAQSGPAKPPAETTKPPAETTKPPAETAGSDSAPAANTVKRASKAECDTFWAAARQNGRTDGEIGRYFEKVLGIKSTAELPADRFREALKWATNEQPTQSEDEKRARQGMGILALNLNEQSELIEAHKQNWSAIADAVSAEIVRRDEA